MGCGAAKMYSEDGSVLPGKGSTEIKWNPAKPVQVAVYYPATAGETVGCQIKKFPMDKTAPDQKFSPEGVTPSSSQPGVFWIDVVPGTRYAMKYVVNGHPVPHPDFPPTNIAKKIMDFQTKDEETKKKFVDALKKDVEKIEKHPYNTDKDNADKTIEAQIAQAKTARSVSEFPDDWKVFKAACMVCEEMQPWNTIDASLDLWTEFGHWDDKKEGGGLERVLGLPDKAKMKAEEEVLKRGAQVPHKAISTGQKVFKEITLKAIMGGAKKAGPEPAELNPWTEQRVDACDHCFPGVARIAEVAPPAPPADAPSQPAPEGDPVIKAAEAFWATDKANIAGIKADDQVDFSKEIEKTLVDAHKAANVEDTDENGIVIVNRDFFQGPATFRSKAGNEANVWTTSNLFQEWAELKVPLKFKATVIAADGSTTEVEKPTITKLPPPAPDAFLDRGRWVMAKDKEERFVTGWIRNFNEATNTVLIEDTLRQKLEVPKANVWILPTPYSVSTQGIADVPQFAPLEFWWVEAEDAQERFVNVWRLGAKDETLQTVKLQPRKQKAAPTEQNKEPTHEVHVGYAGEVELLADRKYAYNFKVGDKYFVDFGKEVTANGFKVITVNQRVVF